MPKDLMYIDTLIYFSNSSLTCPCMFVFFETKYKITYFFKTDELKAFLTQLMHTHTLFSVLPLFWVSDHPHAYFIPLPR